MAHDFVDEVLIFGIDASDFWRNDFFDGRDGFLYAFSAITVQILVARFGSFVNADRCARRHTRARADAIGKPDFDFDRRHATSVEDFSCKNFNNFSHLAIL